MNRINKKAEPLKTSFQQDEGTLLLTRFKQITIITLATVILSAIIFISQKEWPYPKREQMILGMIIILIISNITSFFLIKKNKTSLSINIFSWSMPIAITSILWLDGGLKNPIVACYPIILVVVGLLGKIRNFIGIYLFLAIMIVVLTVTNIYHLNPNPIRDFSYEQLLYVLLITASSGLVSWIFNSDFKNSLRKLNEENNNVRQSQEEINHLAYHDPLTGLLRRAAVAEEYQRKLHETNFTQNNLFLYFLDLDNFKNINDSFDHSAGDTLLIEVSRRLSSLLENGDAISRVGGDEFLMILARPQFFDSQAFAEKILRQIPLPVVLHGVEVDITLSIGIAIVPKDGYQLEDVRKKADIALYKAKQLGKNTFHYYDDPLHQATLRKKLIISTLKKAVKNDLLELYFQPKINIATGHITGAEALLRWVKDNPYDVTPSEFIPLIESTDIIIEIGQWVVQQACLSCQRWHDAGYSTLSIAVNVSGMQLARHNLKATIDSALRYAHLPPRFLEIELTEHLLIAGSSSVLAQLDGIKTLGVDLAIDDFGTGYSSLSYLTKFQVDALKLDKSFISEMLHSADSLAIVKAIISMANIIGLSTIAEGVESEEEWKVLQQLGCQYGQGYLWGEALPEEKFMALLEAKSILSLENTRKELTPRLLLEEVTE